MPYFGDFPLGTVVEIPFDTGVGGFGSTTITGADVNDIKVYKAGTTLRSSQNGYALSIDFGGFVGAHLVTINTGDTSHAGFFVNAVAYKVLFGPYILGGQTVYTWIGTFTLGMGVGLTAAQVRTEIQQALSVDTYADPGQGPPPTTASIVAKLGFVNKMHRVKNAWDSATGQMSFFNDNDTTVDHKLSRTTSGSVTTKTKVVSGP